MLENYNSYRILQEFFKRPTKKHQLRELSRATDLSLPSVKDHIEKLKDMGFIERIDEGVYPGYKAARNEKFKLHKKLDLIRLLHQKRLVDHLNEVLSNPDAIVLFGSAARGEDIEESDIDIL
ncbi:MAG: winged helix-turn-helix transcriptional regulator, partial [Thermoplasmatota archaeon]